ncbi:MAG: hypothetical protein II979_05800, partial [Clostridia bacterium]|nr:hypothetical protein [Clostridia bacterium]
MTRHLSDNLPPPLSSESRPEGHPYDGLRTNHTAVSRIKSHLSLSMAIEKTPRCQAKENTNQRKLPLTPLYASTKIATKIAQKSPIPNPA